jgi:agmatinase
MNNQDFQPRDSFHSPRFGQPATFMRLPHVPDAQEVDIALIGIPYDGGTSYRPGARFGPREIRSQSSLIRPYNPSQAVKPFDQFRIADCGDIDVAPNSIEKTYELIEKGIARFAQTALPISVGGDHSISLPILRALAKIHGPLGLVHFDAHPDTWDEYFGGKYFHGTPFRRAIEEGLVDSARMIQIGIRGPLYGEEDFEFQKNRGIRWVPIDEIREQGVRRIAAEMVERAHGKVYVSFDIDCVDPAFAPGTGTPEVGGLDSYEALTFVRSLAGVNAVGFDIVEVSPLYDGPGQITALLAANLLFEFLSSRCKHK